MSGNAHAHDTASENGSLRDDRAFSLDNFEEVVTVCLRRVGYRGNLAARVSCSTRAYLLVVASFFQRKDTTARCKRACSIRGEWEGGGALKSGCNARRLKHSYITTCVSLPIFVVSVFFSLYLSCFFFCFCFEHRFIARNKLRLARKIPPRYYTRLTFHDARG